MKGFVLPTMLSALLILIGYGAYQFAASQNEAYRVAMAKSEARQSDIRMCRLQLGIDKPEFHFRPLMMACAHEMTVDAPAKGEGRSVIFNRAWDKCMPAMAECEKALSLN